MKAWMLLCIGAMAGACLRQGVSLWFESRLLPPYWGTLAVNLSGSFALGLVMGAWGSGAKAAEPKLALLFWGSGFLGAFTTFSAFSRDLHTLAAHSLPRMLLLGAGQVIGGWLVFTGSFWLMARSARLS